MVGSPVAPQARVDPTPVVKFYLSLGYKCICFHVSLYIVCVSYQLNVRSTMEIRRSRMCDYFLVVFFITSFPYEILCCK